jgi:hypothetical protein
MQADGNLVLYDGDTDTPLGASNTMGQTMHHGHRAVLSSDGTFGIYAHHGRLVKAL